MMKHNLMIRLEKEEEYRNVENLVRESFWNGLEPVSPNIKSDCSNLNKETDIVPV